MNKTQMKKWEENMRPKDVSSVYIQLSRIARARSYTNHDVDVRPVFPLVKQEVIKTALNGVLISTIGSPNCYETMTFPVDLDKKEIVPEILSEARAKTVEGALHNHTEAYLGVSSAMSPAIKSFVEGSKMLDAQVLERLRKDY